MEVYYSLERQNKPTAVALGFFDGMHLGHQKVISKTIEYGGSGLKTCVLTFAQSPRSIVENRTIDLLMGPRQKLSAIQKMGIDTAYMLNFSDIKNMPPENFVKDVLHDMLNAKVVVCGFNYHFGSGGYADADELKRLCNNHKIHVCIVPPVTYENTPVSSTRIRCALKKKEFKMAEDMLF